MTNLKPGEIVRGAGGVSHVDRHPLSSRAGGGTLLGLKGVAALYQLLQVENFFRCNSFEGEKFAKERPHLPLCKGKQKFWRNETQLENPRFGSDLQKNL